MVRETADLISGVDKTLQGVTAYLMSPTYGRLGVTTTDSDGNYAFRDVIKPLDQPLEDLRYYIEFRYNGLAYQAVDLSKDSYAAEDPEARNTFNRKFSKIVHDDADPTLKSDDVIRYNIVRNASELIYGSNPVKGYPGAPDPVNGVYGEYQMTASTRYVTEYKELEIDYHYRLERRTYTSSGTNPDGSTYSVTHTRTVRVPYEYAYHSSPLDFGLYHRERPDLAITQDLHAVNLAINGANHIYLYDSKKGSDHELYDYNDNDASDSDYIYGVAFVDKSRYAETPYTRPIYYSDYVAKSNSGIKELMGSLTYIVKIKNQSSGLNSKVDFVDDFFDSRFIDETAYNPVQVTVSTDYDVKTGETGGKEATWTYEGETGEKRENGEYKYKHVKIDTGGLFGEIGPGEDRTFYVTIKVSRAKIQEIVEAGDGSDNIVEINSYTTSAHGNPYAGIDEDSNPGTLAAGDPDDTDKYEDDTDKAPPIQLVEKKVKYRTLAGNVFEDLTNANDTTRDSFTGEISREGNGILDTGEQGIEGVRVTMYALGKDSTATGDGNEALRTVGNIPPAKVWTEEGDEINGDDATTLSDENGNYEIRGFIPDHYVLEFEWGDEDADGDGEVDRKVIWYKSTIFDDSYHHDGDFWYRNQDPRAQDAYDDFPTRQNIDSNLTDVYYGSGVENDYAALNTALMFSRTNVFIVPEEYEDKPNEKKIKTDMSEEPDEYNIQNVDFGIALRPKQSVELEKYISHIAIESEGGNKYLDTNVANPLSQFSGNGPDEAHLENPGLANATVYNGPDSGANPNVGNLWIQSDTVLRTGGTLSVRYEINVINNGEVDYEDYGFQKYGLKYNNRSNLVRINAARINDYADTEWSISEDGASETGWEKWSLDELQNPLHDYDGVDPAVYNSKDSEIRNRIILSTDARADKDVYGLAPGMSLKEIIIDGEEGVLKVNVEKELSTARTSYPQFVNEAEITRLTKNGGSPVTYDYNAADNRFETKLVVKPGNYVPGTGYAVSYLEHSATEGEDDQRRSAVITITSDTGENLEFIIPTMIGIAAFAILVGGIVFIKKEVLGNKRNKE